MNARSTHASMVALVSMAKMNICVLVNQDGLENDAKQMLVVVRKIHASMMLNASTSSKISSAYAHQEPTVRCVK